MPDTPRGVHGSQRRVAAWRRRLGGAMLIPESLRRSLVRVCRRRRRSLCLAGMVGLASTMLATATVWLVGARLTELLLAQATARAADELALGIIGRVSADDFIPPYAAASLNGLGERLDPVVARLRQAGSGVLRVNVVAADGTVIYSDNHEARGKAVPPSEKPQLEAALGGAVGSIGHSGLATDENADLRAAHEEAFEIYVPVVLGETVVGAYEIYQDPAPLSAVLKTLWLLLVAAFAILLSIPVPWASARPSRASPAVSSVAPYVSVSLASVAEDASAGPGTVLTPRELQVLRMMASPLSYREIASALVISEETVRTHSKHVLRKLGQPDRTNAVLSAVAGGLLQLPERSEEHASTPDGSAAESAR